MTEILVELQTCPLFSMGKLTNPPFSRDANDLEYRFVVLYIFTHTVHNCM